MLNSPLTREARKEELETIYGIATRAFVHDPVMNYFGSLEQVSFKLPCVSFGEKEISM